MLSAEIVFELLGFDEDKELKEVEKIEEEGKKNTERFEKSIKKLSALL